MSKHYKYYISSNGIYYRHIKEVYDKIYVYDPKLHYWSYYEFINLELFLTHKRILGRALTELTDEEAEITLTMMELVS